MIIAISLYRKTTYYKSTHNSFLSVKFNKGKYGEYLIYKRLKSQEKSGARFLFNAYLPKANNETTEIDVIMVNKNGVFVFESKNYSGWIFGDENQKKWTQCLPKGKYKVAQKEHFLNPIFQNRLHISAIKNQIGESYPIYSIIAFSERCTLKSINVTDQTVCVINRNNVAYAVNNLSALKYDCLSQQDVESIYSKLFVFTQVSKEIKEKHIDTVKSNVEINRSSIQNSNYTMTQTVPNKDSVLYNNCVPMICPKCGGKLVIRTATRGTNAGKQFYGCSNYPKCHFIKNI